MFLPFFETLRRHGVPASLREFLSFLEALDAGLATYDVDAFYYLARATLVKNEAHIDCFDRAFAEAFSGIESIPVEAVVEALDLPEDWLRKMAEKHLTPEEMAEGVRIGQLETRHRKAVKVWDKREFRDFDDTREIGTRSIKVALKRLRQWARTGAADELDLDGTIRATAEHGYLDVQTRPERRNAVRVLLFLDVGGSMDDHVHIVEELFSAARTEFKHLEHFYFHNCLYEAVWRDNRRRWNAQVATWDVLNRFGPGYKAIFVGDAAMSPYEVAAPGGANEHWNAEAGETWLRRAFAHWPDSLWINPIRDKAARGRSFQALARMGKVIFPAHAPCDPPSSPESPLPAAQFLLLSF